MQTDPVAEFDYSDPELRLFAYLLAASETEERPSDVARPGDLRRRAGGGFWIFDGDAWVEW